MPWAYRRAAGITAVSRGVADDLISELRLDPVCVKVIYNPVVTDRLLRLSAEPLDHPWAEGNVPIFIGIGRLTSAKNFPLLINAFAKVRETVPCRLVILGEGELRNELEALVEKLGRDEDVYMPGVVANPYQWLVASTAFVLSLSNVNYFGRSHCLT